MTKRRSRSVWHSSGRTDARTQGATLTSYVTQSKPAATASLPSRPSRLVTTVAGAETETIATRSPRPEFGKVGAGSAPPAVALAGGDHASSTKTRLPGSEEDTSSHKVRSLLCEQLKSGADRSQHRAHTGHGHRQGGSSPGRGQRALDVKCV